MELLKLSREEKHNLLKKYGVFIPLDEIDDIQIKSLDPEKKGITFINNKTNIIVTSNLDDKLSRFCPFGFTTTSLRVSNLDESTVDERFHYVAGYEQIGEKLLKARENSLEANYSRAYKNLVNDNKTHCFLIEERNIDSENGYRSITLYNDCYQGILEEYNNEFYFPKNVIFRLKYFPQSHFHQAFIREPDNSLSSFYQYDGMGNAPLCAYERYYSFNKLCYSGVILINGSVKLNGNDHLPRNINTSEFQEFEEDIYDSKAYFSIGKESLIIVKKDGVLFVYVKSNGNKELLGRLDSVTDSGFCSDDFSYIIDLLCGVQISDELREHVIRQLSIYINTHDKEDFGKLSIPDIKLDDYSLMKESFDNDDMFEKSDELLDRLSEIFLSEYLRTKKLSYKVYKSNE